MTLRIDQDLEVRGIAEVLVAYKATTRSERADAMAAVEKYFVVSDRSHANALMVEARQPTPRPFFHFTNLGISLGTVDARGLAALKQESKRVASVNSTPVLSLIRPISSAPVSLDAMADSLTWGLKLMRVRELWDQAITGKGILVGHLDTGVDGNHPALATAIAQYTIIDDLGQESQNLPKPPRDTSDHGTHTAGTIAGRSVSGKTVGVAPEAQLASATVIEGGNSVARVLGGMDWAISKQVHVLNMSVGIRGFVDSWLEVVRSLRSHNVLPIFGSGNEGTGTSRSPANYADAFSVGAIGEDGRVADFSSSQQFTREENPIVPDIIAPGVDILSAMPGGDWQMMSGSSMATPHVAGLAALLFQAKPDATADQVEQAIITSCQGVPPLEKNRAGNGYPDAVRALAALRESRATGRTKPDGEIRTTGWVKPHGWI
jgi:subtilisin